MRTVYDHWADHWIAQFCIEIPCNEICYLTVYGRMYTAYDLRIVNCIAQFCTEMHNYKLCDPQIEKYSITIYGRIDVHL